MDVLNQEFGEGWVVYNGDCVELTKGLSDNSIHYTLFSPPFSSLYTYSNSDRDMGNAKSDEEFYAQFSYLVEELFRVTMPGRHVSFHCMNIPAMKERDGYIGIKDFRGDLIRMFQAKGFIFHGEVTIWKDPLIEATRTKALGLMHKQLCKDSAMCRQGLPDYVVHMRKPGVNKEPVVNPVGLTHYAGSDPPGKGNFSHNTWRKYASPVWMDIRQTNTLNYTSARHKDDERHICPLQLDSIERCITLYTNEGDTVLSPFGGVGSEGYQAVTMGRNAISIELKESYYHQNVKNMKRAERQEAQPELPFGKAS